MKNIEEVLREMRLIANERDDCGLPWEASEIDNWVEAIEAAMREPVAFQFGPELDWVANHWPPQNPGKGRIRPLFALPPDAAGKIERLSEVIDRAAKAWMSLEPPVAWEGDVADAMAAGVSEIERLRRRSVMPADIGGSARNTEAEEKPAWMPQGKRSDVFELKLRRPILKALAVKEDK